MDTIVHNTIHILLALTLPPLLLGVIAKTKALFAGRVGPPLLQAYYDLVKLFQKGSVFSTTTTWVFRAGPVVGLVTTAAAALLIPLTDLGAPISFTGDLILLAYLLGLGRFFSGGPYVDNPEVHNGCASLVPVDLFIPGCPPHPMTILDGLLRLLGRLERKY